MQHLIFFESVFIIPRFVQFSNISFEPLQPPMSKVCAKKKKYSANVYKVLKVVVRNIVVLRVYKVKFDVSTVTVLG